MVGDGELPGIGEKYSDDVSGAESGGNEAVGKGFDEGCVFAVGNSTIAGRVDKRGLDRVKLTILEDDVVQEQAGGIGEKGCALHW